MKRKGLLRAMGNIDEKYIKSAENHFTESKGKRAAATVFKVLGYAASFSLIIGFAVFIWITAQNSRDPIKPAESGTKPSVTAQVTDKETDMTTEAVTVPEETQAQTTQPVVTEAPETEPPTTEAPVTEPPSTEAPTTEAPATEPPTTEAPVTEPPAVLVSSITINAPQTSLKVGDKMKLTATVSPENADNKDVVWSIASGSSYAKISSDGTLTAKAAGVCTVRAKAADGSGVTANIKITVEEPVTEVFEEVVYLPVDAPQRTLTADETERLYRIYVNIMRNYSHITPGERFQIWIAGAEPDIKLSVNDVNLEIISGSQYAELDQRDVFTAKSEGTVKIRATLKANAGIKAERTITITHPKKVDTWKGSGTFRDPYLIESVEDFEKIRTVCGADSNECYWFRQTKDLDFSGISWVPFDAFFTHNYDGGGHKITNVTVDQNVSREPSLFGYVKMSVIKDLTIENFTNVNIAYRCFDGGVLFGAGIGSSVFNCHVKNATVDLQGDEASTVGGFVGTTVEPCIFVGCTTNAVCKAVSEVGGFIGTVQMDEMASVFYNCKATGTSESTGDPARCGGFFGKGEGYSESILDWLLKVHYVKGCTSTQRDKVLDAANK